MQLTAEVKDDNYQELPRQQEAMYAKSTDTFLRADASSGKHYYDLNAASKSYCGPWLFGKEHVEVNVNRMRGQWVQWCPIPADIRDGVLMRGNVIYQNPDGTYRMSADVYEGVIETQADRYFVGKTQHTFQAPNLPGGRMQVVANIRIRLNERLAYNPMIPRSQQSSVASSPAPNYSQYQQQQQQQPAVGSYSNYQQQQPVASGYGNYQQPAQPAWGCSHNEVLAQPQGDQVQASYGGGPNYYGGGQGSTRQEQRDSRTFKNDPDGGF
ncbi:MAG: hypothetical protein IT342_02130 [Candidatus Melainabacteria bacterium]|nr:hypothetical protein [Candidatus Melainabacteria bacterium]